MADITFSESSGVTDSLYGKSQEPIKMIIENRAQLCEDNSVLPHLFAMEKSKHWAEKYTAMTAFNDFEPVGESGEYPTNGWSESYSKTLSNVVWKSKFSITREIIDDGNIIDLKKKPAGFTTAYYATREKFGARLYGEAIKGNTSFMLGNEGFSTLGADGVCVFNAAHPSKVSGTTQCNLFSDEFSADALAAHECAMQSFMGDNDDILTVSPDTIVIPNHYALKKAVFAAVGADKDPATANNGFNFLYGRWRVIVWSYLNSFITAGSAPWMLLDSKYNKDASCAIFQDRVKLEIRSEIASNDDNVWKGYARFTGGFNDWRGMSLAGISGAGNSLIGA